MDRRYLQHNDNARPAVYSATGLSSSAYSFTASYSGDTS